MKRSELRAQMREDRRRWKQEARATRARLKARVEEQMRAPAFAPLLERRARAKRRRRIATLLAILLLLLLLLIECDPAPAGPAVVQPPTPEVVVDDTVTPPKKKPVRKKRRRKPLTGKIDGSERADVDVEPPAPPSWLPKFRLQVAARSPRLAACFNGSEQPGAMRWTALVHAPTGRASDSVLEPVFRGASVDNTQRECLEAALSEPRYRLPEPDPSAVARRVSIIFEF